MYIYKNTKTKQKISKKKHKKITIKKNLSFEEKCLQKKILNFAITGN